MVLEREESRREVCIAVFLMYCYLLSLILSDFYLVAGSGCNCLLLVLL